MSRPVGSQRTIRERQRALLRWYHTHGRHTLPWRLTRDPYGILVSEVMLQQTQVDRVIPYWETWMRRWPTAVALAAADRADVIRAWAGLGYNRRAVHLHACAREVARTGWPIRIPPPRRADAEALARALEALPGVGPYTSRALLSFAWDLPGSCVDTNVRRVLAHAIYRRPAIMRMPLPEVMRLAARVIPRGQARVWNYALMDYGALVLRARDIPNPPKRTVAPFRGSSRFWRGRIVAILRDAPRALPRTAILRALAPHGDAPDDLDALLSALVRDGVVAVDRGSFRIA